MTYRTTKFPPYPVTTSSNPDLPLEEWNFDDVPDEELRACLIWECARECIDLIFADEATELTELAQPEKWNQEEHKFIKNSLSARKKALRQLDELNFDLEQHWRRIYKHHLSYNSFYEMALRRARPWSIPWQKIDANSRRKAVEQLNDRGIFQPLRLSYVRELESLWNSNSTEIRKFQKRESASRRAERIEMLGYDDIKPIEIFSQEGDPKNTEMVAAFTIDFELYTDGEIVNSFREWLRKARCCASPVRRGKKLNDERAALDGIGMMRSLHYRPFSNSDFPKQLRKRGRRACYKGRQLALNRFHELLPFLTAETRPLSWQTASESRASKFD